MSKQALVVSGPFVPANEPMTLLPYKHLRLLDYHYDVVALAMNEDESLKQKLAQDKHYKKFNVQFVKKYKDVLFSIQNVNLIKALMNMQRYIQLALKQADKKQYDLVYTSAFPAYTHRVGYQIKKKNKKIKWVANFTDPINNSPYKKDQDTYNSYSFLEKIAFHAYSYFYVSDKDEVIAFDNADLLVFICEEQRQFMIEQYQKKSSKCTKEEIMEKSCIVPLNYVVEWEDMMPLKETSKNTKLRVAHFGRVYGLRKIEKFIVAVDELIKENPSLKDRFVIEQYGEFKKADIQLIKKLKLEHCFEIKEKISYQACLQKMSESDVLLIFDTIMNEDSWQPYLPSKVLEYAMLKKNVFAIATKKSPTYRIMKESDALCANYDVKDIKEKLKEALQGKSSIVKYDYTNEEAVKELVMKLNSL